MLLAIGIVDQKPFCRQLINIGSTRRTNYLFVAVIFHYNNNDVIEIERSFHQIDTEFGLHRRFDCRGILLGLVGDSVELVVDPYEAPGDSTLLMPGAHLVFHSVRTIIGGSQARVDRNIAKIPIVAGRVGCAARIAL